MSAPAWPPCRAAKQARATQRAGHRWGARADAVSGGVTACWASRGTTRQMPKKAGTATVSLAGKLDHRAVPYTVPMKAVPRECGSLGRFRPALRLVRGAYGPFRAAVLVRTMRRTGRPVPPLRPRQPLLQPGLWAPGQGRLATPIRPALPALPARAQGARATHSPLAPARSGCGGRGRSRQPRCK